MIKLSTIATRSTRYRQSRHMHFTNIH